MDIESPAAGSDLGFVSAFSITLPLPFRALFLIGFGGACWATNLHVLHLIGIDTAHILDIRNEPSTSTPYTTRNGAISPLSLAVYAHPSTLYTPIYKILAAYFTWVFAGWALFRLLTAGMLDNLDKFKFIPIITSFGVLVALFIPFNPLHRRERSRLFESVRRCCTSPRRQPVYFSDVIVADVFTSFAKVLGDLWLSISLLAPSASLKVVTSADGMSAVAVPILMSLPYLVRFRQCIIDYLGSDRTSQRPLHNAIKYATAFPVIFLSAAQVFVMEEDPVAKSFQDEDSAWHGEHQLFRLWLLAVLVNSGYSFWWDVTNDWGLELLTPVAWSRKTSPVSLQGDPSDMYLPQSAGGLHPPGAPKTPNLISPIPSPSHSRRHSASSIPSSLPFSPTSANDRRSFDGQNPYTASSGHSSTPFGLRNRLIFRDPTVYYLAIVLNFILRFTWSLKLSSHLHTVAELESGVFLMETLELIRRWMWVFFRVEWEAVKKGSPIEEPLLLRDFPGGEMNGDMELPAIHHTSMGLSVPLGSKDLI